MNEKEQRKILIIVDYQNDFANPKGSLYVPKGEMIYYQIARLIAEVKFDLVVATKDMHPRNHCSFKPYGGMWPIHCVTGTWGAELALPNTQEISYESDIDYILHKGRKKDTDSYSAFFDNNGSNYTGLGELIKPYKDEEVHVYICGLALDYCVKFTAVHTLRYTNNVFIISDAVKAVEQDEEKIKHFCEGIKELGIKFINSGDMVGVSK